MYGQRETSLCAGINKSGCALLSGVYCLYDLGLLGAGLSPTELNEAAMKAHDGGILDKEFEVQDWNEFIRFFSNGRASYGGYLHESELKISPFHAPPVRGIVAEWKYADDRPERHFTCNLYSRPHIVKYDPWPGSVAVQSGSIISYRVFKVDHAAA